MEIERINLEQKCKMALCDIRYRYTDYVKQRRFTILDLYYLSTLRKNNYVHKNRPSNRKFTQLPLSI